MLYPLDQEIQQIIDSSYDEETGELLIAEDELQAKLSEAVQNFDDGIDSIISGVKNLRADVAAIDAEIDNLEKRRNSLKKKADRYADFAAYLLNGQKWHNQRHSVSFRKSGKVELDEKFLSWAKEYGQKFLTFKPAPEPTADKKKIATAIKNGERVPYAYIAETNNIQIK